MHNRLLAIAGGVLSLWAAQMTSAASEYLFTAGGQLSGSDPLLSELTAVSGRFLYDNTVPANSTIPPGFSTSGSTIYFAPTDLTGIANADTFRDPRGFASVGDDKYVPIEEEPGRDFFGLNWDQQGLNLVGFTFNGLNLINVQFFWIEDQDGIADFLTDQSLPESLPPTSGGRVGLYFIDSQGTRRNSFYSVSLEYNGEVELDVEGGSLIKLIPFLIKEEPDAP